MKRKEPTTDPHAYARAPQQQIQQQQQPSSRPTGTVPFPHHSSLSSPAKRPGPATTALHPPASSSNVSAPRQRPRPPVYRSDLKARLPESFLPSRGRITNRPSTCPKVGLHLHGPYANVALRERSNDIISYMRASDGEGWRFYDHVEFFGGLHHLRVRLTDYERAYCRRRWGNEAESDGGGGNNGNEYTHGWCIYEDTSRPKPPNKACLPSRFCLYKKPVVLISLFDGIGGARVALDKLPDHYGVVASFSSEKDETAKAVVKRFAPDTIELPNVDEIGRDTVMRKVFGNRTVQEHMSYSTHGDELQFVVVAGPPCQDLSRANAKDGVTLGALNGTRSSMFFHVPRILNYLLGEAIRHNGDTGHRTVHFIVENVEMSDKDKRIFTEFLNDVKPFRVDFNSGGCCASWMSRRRHYWCSVLPEGGEVGLEAFRALGCAHPARGEGGSLDAVLRLNGRDGYEFFDRTTGKKVTRLGTMTRRAHQGGQEKYYIRRKDDPECTGDDVEEVPQYINEDLLGFPRDHTKEGVGGRELSESSRRLLLGNTFMVFHIQCLFKRMHLYLSDPLHIKNHKYKYIPRLPQEVCEEKLKEKNTSIDTRFYQEVLSVLNNNLKFDAIEKASKKTLFGCL